MFDMGNSNIFILKGIKKEEILRFSVPGRYFVFLFNFSGEVRVEIEKEGVEVYIFGVYFGKNKDNFSLSTVQHHKVGGSVSDLLVKGVFTEESRFFYQGLIRIEKKAQKSHAYQKNQNLVLSPKVFVESRPFLEILANDVFCTHGSTTGRLDKDQLLYLRMRGISESRAKKLLVRGFINEVFDRIEEVVGKNLPEKIKKEKETIFKDLERIKI